MSPGGGSSDQDRTVGAELRPDNPVRQKDRPAGPVSDETSSSSQAAGEGASSSPPAADPANQDEAREVEQDFEKLLADANQQKDEYLELARRTKADFENFRKRMTAEVQAAARRSKAEFARELLPVVDSLERALRLAGIDSVASAASSDAVDSHEQGLLLIFRDLHQVLKRSGIEAFDPKGEKFDPTEHEALSQAPAEGVEPGLVIEVVQNGFRMEDQLIRPARVVVSA